MVKHKLLHKEITSLADSFAVSDSAMRPIRLSTGGVIQEQGAAQSADAGHQGLSRRERRENNHNNSNNNQQNNQYNHGKRKDEQPDTHYGSRQVAVV